MIRKGLGLILLSILCLAMKMILAILLSELALKIRHWFTTLTQSQKCRANNGSILALPPAKKFKRVHLAGKVMVLIVWDSQGVIMIDYLEQGCTINGAYYAGESRRLHREITRRRRGKMTHGVLILQENAPAHTSYTVITARLNVELKFFLTPHILLIWLLLTSICSQTEIPSSRYTVWKQ